MGRFTVYNNITTPEKIAAINPENVALMNDFLEYLDSVGRAQSTIKNYRSDLLIFFCWCEDSLGNKSFVELTKRELVRFQSHAVNEWKWSPCRVRTVKATLSSLSNYIENILDDDYKGYKPIVRKIESPPKQAVREKTVYSDEEIKALLDELVRRKEYPHRSTRFHGTRSRSYRAVRCLHQSAPGFRSAVFHIPHHNR